MDLVKRNTTCRYSWVLLGEPSNALAEVVKISSRELLRPKQTNVVLQHEAIHPLHTPRREREGGVEMGHQREGVNAHGKHASSGVGIKQTCLDLLHAW